MQKDDWFCLVYIKLPFRWLLPDLPKDAIYYASTEYKPHTLIDVATLTGYASYALPYYCDTNFVQCHGCRPRRNLCWCLLGMFLYPVKLGSSTHQAMKTSDKLWEQLHVAGEAEYDRFWRMPLDEDYGVQIHSSNADLQNVSSFPCFCFFIFIYHSHLDWWAVCWKLHSCFVLEALRCWHRG